jgi:hypothetical protein
MERWQKIRLHVRTFEDAKEPKHNNTILVSMLDVIVDVSNR